MTPAEDLREAANLIRQRAKAATSGPWKAHPDGLFWGEGPGDPACGADQIGNAEHIASWNPPVALAVADWLDAAAERRPLGLSPNHWPADLHAALKLARLYVGGTR